MPFPVTRSQRTAVTQKEEQLHRGRDVKKYSLFVKSYNGQIIRFEKKTFCTFCNLQNQFGDLTALVNTAVAVVSPILLFLRETSLR